MVPEGWLCRNRPDSPIAQLDDFLISTSHLAHIYCRIFACGLKLVSLQQQHLFKVPAEHLAAGQACHAAADDNGLQRTAQNSRHLQGRVLVFVLPEAVVRLLFYGLVRAVERYA